MAEMKSRERIRRMYEHREADRVPITDSPWKTTMARWYKEGLPDPDQTTYEEFFGIDLIGYIGVDNSPRFPARIIRETPEYVIRTTQWGVTLREWTHRTGVPEFLDYSIKDPESWKKAKARMKPSRDRIDWRQLDAAYHEWQQKGAWLAAYLWFGFDVTHAWAVGTERLLTAMATDPEWCVDMFNTFLDLDLALFDMIWDEGYTFDEVHWPDDMAYNGRPFFSLDMYRNLLKPAHKRACDWAHKKGLKVHFHSCGNVTPFIPDLLEIGVDMLSPLQVRAGCDPVALKKQYGDRLAFCGGISCAALDDHEKMAANMKLIVPTMKENGGYVLASDNGLPDSVSVDDYRCFVRLAKQLGAY